MAAAHVADGHVVGIDHAEPFVARGRLSDLAPAAQSIHSILLVGGVTTIHVDSPFRSTSMKLMHDCVNEITPELLQ